MARILFLYFIIVLIPIIVLAERKRCGPPPIPRGLQIKYKDYRNYFIGHIVFYECDFGFYSEEVSGTTICELLPGKDQPEWAIPDITCYEECAIPRVEHGEVVMSFSSYYHTPLYKKFPVGSLMDSENDYFLMCKAPYRPMGEYADKVKVTCKNKKWMKIPECIEAKTECEPLIPPEHGSIIYTTIEKTKIGSIALFKCNLGYTLIGSTTSKCFEDIGWVFPTPKCKKEEIIEVKPPVVEQPLLTEIPIKNPDPLHTDAPEITTAANTEKCNTFVAHGTIRQVKDYRHNGPLKEDATDVSEEFEWSCNRGYEPNGQEVFKIKLFCVHGQWSETPECLPAKCQQNPPWIANGHPLEPIRRNHNAKVSYVCDRNYQKIEPSHIICRYGQWTGRIPGCLASPSPSPSPSPPPPPSPSPATPRPPVPSPIVSPSPGFELNEFSQKEFEKVLTPLHQKLLSSDFLTNILNIALNNSFNANTGQFQNFTGHYNVTFNANDGTNNGSQTYFIKRIIFLDGLPAADHR